LLILWEVPVASRRGSDNVSDGWPPDSPRLTPRSERGEEQRQSIERPPSIEVTPQPGFFASGLTSQDVSDRPPSNSSLTPRSHRGEERRQSILRPPSIEQTNLIAGELPSQHDNKVLLGSKPYENLVKIDPADPGQWALLHHRINLVKLYKDHRNNWFNSLVKPYEDRWNHWFNSLAKPYVDHWNHWFNTSQGDNESSRKEGYIIVSLAELQRMRLRKLQIKLVNEAVLMHSSKKESDSWEATLQQYSMCHVLPKTASD
jgi:hypothetical protein